MGRARHRNMVSVHVMEATGRSTSVEVHDDRTVAAQLVTAVTRTLSAYQSEVREHAADVAQASELLARLGISDLARRLAEVWRPHPSTVGEPPTEEPWGDGTAVDQLRELVAHARAYGVSDDDLRAALEDALAGDPVPDDDRPEDLGGPWPPTVTTVRGGVRYPVNVPEMDVARLVDDSGTKQPHVVELLADLQIERPADDTVAAVAHAVPGRPGVYQSVVELPADDQPAPEDGYDVERHYLPGTDTEVDRDGHDGPACTHPAGTVNGACPACGPVELDTTADVDVDFDRTLGIQ